MGAIQQGQSASWPAATLVCACFAMHSTQYSCPHCRRFEGPASPSRQVAQRGSSTCLGILTSRGDRRRLIIAAGDRDAIVLMGLDMSSPELLHVELLDTGRGRPQPELELRLRRSMVWRRRSMLAIGTSRSVGVGAADLNTLMSVLFTLAARRNSCPFWFIQASEIRLLGLRHFENVRLRCKAQHLRACKTLAASESPSLRRVCRTKPELSGARAASPRAPPPCQATA